MKRNIKVGFMYILLCSDGTYYTGSTINIEKRLREHQTGYGAKHTQNRLPVSIIYIEQFDRIEDAFYREKQVQKWRREKKEALIRQELSKLPALASTSSANGSR